MAQAYQLNLSEEQEQELRRLRDHCPLPYVRVRAAAILKVAQGSSIRWVARSGLLKPVHPDRLREWIRRYLSEGAAGLRIRSGRGRKPMFSPSA
jgi:hypothetical protein